MTCQHKRSAWGFAVIHGWIAEKNWRSRGFQRCFLKFFSFSRWWSQISFIFTPTWRNDPIWLIFFQWVETTKKVVRTNCDLLIGENLVHFEQICYFCVLLQVHLKGSTCFKNFESQKLSLKETIWFFCTLKIFSTFQLQLSEREVFFADSYHALVGWLPWRLVGSWFGPLGASEPVGSQGHHFSPEPWLFRFDIGDDKLPNYMGIIS